jgi:hypothetical protein
MRTKSCGRGCGDPCHKAGSGASAQPRRSIGKLFRGRSGGRNLPGVNDRPKAAKKARQQRRLGAALRENLRRRKAQARGRSTVGVADGAGKPHDSAGIGGNKQES